MLLIWWVQSLIANSLLGNSGSKGTPQNPAHRELSLCAGHFYRLVYSWLLKAGEEHLEKEQPLPKGCSLLQDPAKPYSCHLLSNLANQDSALCGPQKPE